MFARLAAFAVAGLVFSHSETASSQTLTEKDLSRIVDASQNNDLRFKRDFKGKDLKIHARFIGADEGFFGYWIVKTRSVSNIEVDCFTRNKELLDSATEWNAGQPVIVIGAINDTVMGDIQLGSGCSISAQSE